MLNLYHLYKPKRGCSTFCFHRGSRGETGYDSRCLAQNWGNQFWPQEVQCNMAVPWQTQRFHVTNSVPALCLKGGRCISQFLRCITNHGYPRGPSSLWRRTGSCCEITCVWSPLDGCRLPWKNKWPKKISRHNLVI